MLLVIFIFYFCKYSILLIGASQEQHKEKNGSIFCSDSGIRLLPVICSDCDM